MEKQYVLVVNNEIVSTPAPIPNNYKNISNIFALPDEQLSDLSWSGNNEGFWLVTSDPVPTMTIKQKIETTYSLNIQNKSCHQSHTVVSVEPHEEEVRINLIKSNIRMIRDRYLLITDFTQLSDAPISENSKLDFKTFRHQLRIMLDIPDITKAVWPDIPTSASNINIPEFPSMPSFNG